MESLCDYIASIAVGEIVLYGNWIIIPILLRHTLSENIFSKPFNRLWACAWFKKSQACC